MVHSNLKPIPFRIMTKSIVQTIVINRKSIRDLKALTQNPKSTTSPKREGIDLHLLNLHLPMIVIANPALWVALARKLQMLTALNRDLAEAKAAALVEKAVREAHQVEVVHLPLIKESKLNCCCLYSILRSLLSPRKIKSIKSRGIWKSLLNYLKWQLKCSINTTKKIDHLRSIITNRVLQKVITTIMLLLMWKMKSLNLSRRYLSLSLLIISSIQVQILKLNNRLLPKNQGSTIPTSILIRRKAQRSNKYRSSCLQLRLWKPQWG